MQAGAFWRKPAFRSRRARFRAAASGEARFALSDCTRAGPEPFRRGLASGRDRRRRSLPRRSLEQGAGPLGRVYRNGWERRARPALSLAAADGPALWSRPGPKSAGGSAENPRADRVRLHGEAESLLATARTPSQNLTNILGASPGSERLLGSSFSSGALEHRNTALSAGPRKCSHRGPALRSPGRLAGRGAPQGVRNRPWQPARAPHPQRAEGHPYPRSAPAARGGGLAAETECSSAMGCSASECSTESSRRASPAPRLTTRRALRPVARKCPGKIEGLRGRSL